MRHEWRYGVMNGGIGAIDGIRNLSVLGPFVSVWSVCVSVQPPMPFDSKEQMRRDDLLRRKVAEIFHGQRTDGNGR
jgi:hypothetical protein